MAWEMKPTHLPRETKPLTIGLLFGGLTAVLPWFSPCDAFCFAFFAMLILSAIDRFFLRSAFAAGQLQRAQWIAGMLLVGIPALGFSIGAGNRAFVAAFGVPPEGVKNLSVDIHYVGGPGDMMTRIEFNTDEATLKKLVAARGMKLSEVAMIAPFTNRPNGPCEAYDWFTDGSPTKGPLQSLQLYWYPAVHRAFAVHHVG